MSGSCRRHVLMLRPCAFRRGPQTGQQGWRVRAVRELLGDTGLWCEVRATCRRHAWLTWGAGPARSSLAAPCSGKPPGGAEGPPAAERPSGSRHLASQACCLWGSCDLRHCRGTSESLGPTTAAPLLRTALLGPSQDVCHSGRGGVEPRRHGKGKHLCFTAADLRAAFPPVAVLTADGSATGRGGASLLPAGEQVHSGLPLQLGPPRPLLT